jgi:hypothetical protein
MTEAVFTRKQVEELPPQESMCGFTHVFAVISRFPEYIFMSNGPGDRRHREPQNQEPQKLSTNGTHAPWMCPIWGGLALTAAFNMRSTGADFAVLNSARVSLCCETALMRAKITGSTPGLRCTPDRFSSNIYAIYLRLWKSDLS